MWGYPCVREVPLTQCGATGLKPAALWVIGTRGVPGVADKSDIGFQKRRNFIGKI